MPPCLITCHYLLRTKRWEIFWRALLRKKMEMENFWSSPSNNKTAPWSLLVGFNSGAYSFYPTGLPEWDTLKTVLRMATTRWKVLMFVCGFRVYISCLVSLLDRSGSIKEGYFDFRHFVCEFYRRMDTVGMFEKSSSSLSLSIHFMSTSSINLNHERGCLSDERSNRSSRSPIQMLA